MQVVDCSAELSLLITAAVTNFPSIGEECLNNILHSVLRRHSVANLSLAHNEDRRPPHNSIITFAASPAQSAGMQMIPVVASAESTRLSIVNSRRQTTHTKSQKLPLHVGIYQIYIFAVFHQRSS